MLDYGIIVVLILLLLFYLQKRYRWDDAHASVIQALFWQKCAVRTKDNLNKERQKALHNAEIDHPGQGEQYMHEHCPWWCAHPIWVQMCEQWRAESWVKRRKTAASNRSSGVSEGEKAKGTYKGGSISQLQHIAARVRMYNKLIGLVICLYVYSHVL